MATNTYETLFILDSNHYARDPGGVSSQIETLVTEAGGSVLVNRMWMEQKLAYPIDGHQKGTYWLCYFEMEPTELTKLARAFQLNEAILREMTLKLDYRLVEAILANARGESIRPSSTEDGVVNADEVKADEVTENEEEEVAEV